MIDIPRPPKGPPEDDIRDDRQRGLTSRVRSYVNTKARKISNRSIDARSIGGNSKVCNKV